MINPPIFGYLSCVSTQTPHTPKAVPVSLRDFLAVFLPVVYAPGDGIRLARSSGTRFANELASYADLVKRITVIAQAETALLDCLIKNNNIFLTRSKYANSL